MDNHELTPEEQLRYLALQARQIGLGRLYKQAKLVRQVHGGILPDEVISLLEMVEEEHTKAEDDYKYFVLEHPDKSVRPFNPDDIEMAIDEEVEPLNFDEPNDIDEPEGR